MGRRRCAGCLGGKAEFDVGLTVGGWGIGAALGAWWECLVGERGFYVWGLDGIIYILKMWCRVRCRGNRNY